MCRITYLVSRISEVQARSIECTFRKVIECVLASPKQQISSLDLLSQYDTTKILQWNNYSLETVSTCVHRLFEQRVRDQPQAQALCTTQRSLTYADLNNLSNKLARHLIGVNIKPGTIVPLYFEKSMWMVVAMMGVLKVGGAFLFLEPANPVNRLLELVRTVDAHVVLSFGQLPEALMQESNVTLDISHFFNEDGPKSVENMDAAVTASDPAYIIFTSGSTGRPKGVVIKHEAISSFSTICGKSLGITSSTRALQYASTSFDVSYSEIIATLVLGGCVCLPSKDERQNDIMGAMNKMDVNWATFTPSVVRLIEPSAVPRLKTLVLGAEPLPRDVFEIWFGKVRLLAGYGPTECTVYCTVHEFQSLAESSSTLGRSARSSRCWIVNKENPHLLAPIGTVGELVVEGSILFRDYLNDPAKTDQSLLLDPAWMHDIYGSKRLYRTGDLVRCSPDGNISILGRKDRQIKLNGHRIELSEIEFRMRKSLPEVKDVIVEVVSSGLGKNQKALTAFTTLRNNFSIENTESLPGAEKRNKIADLSQVCRRALSQDLPKYMIPQAVIPVSEIPVTVAGKVNRNKLLELVSGISDEDLLACTGDLSEYQAPSSDVELMMQSIWAELLAVESTKVGANDNFFNVGGDSLKAIVLVSRLRESGFSLAVETLLRNPRLSQMCQALTPLEQSDAIEVGPFETLDEGRGGKEILLEMADQCNVTIGQVEDIYACTPLQQMFMQDYLQAPGIFVGNFVFAISSNVDVSRLCEAWESVVAANPILRTRIGQTSSNRFFQVVLKGKIRWQSTQSVEQYMKDEKTLSMGPGQSLSRFTITQSARHLIWTVHHALLEGWNIPMLIKSVGPAYNGIAPKPQAGYNTFIKFVQSIRSDATKNYWKSQLSGWKTCGFPVVLPTEYEPRTLGVLRQNSHFPCPQRSSSAITNSTIARAAWALVLLDFGKTDDIVFCSTLVGRNAPIARIEDISGTTCTRVPVRVRLDYTKTAAKFLQQIHEQAIEMIPFEHYGIDSIRALGPAENDACNFVSAMTVQSGPVLATLDETSPGVTYVGPLTPINLKYPISLEVRFACDVVHTTCHFDPEVVDEGKMREIIERFAYMVEQMTIPAEGKSLGEIIRAASIGEIDRPVTTTVSRKPLW